MRWLMAAAAAAVAILTDAPLAARAAPEQGHLALSDIGMSVTWVEKTPPPPAAIFNVIYGLSHDGLDRTSHPAVNRTYSIRDMCGAPANLTSNFVDPGLILFAEIDLRGVAPGTTVFYSFGTAGPRGARSPTYAFTHGPKSQHQTSFIAYGDMGLMGSYHNSTEEILAHLDDVDFVLHIGDISYAEGQGFRWDSWFREIEPVSTRVPYHVCLGNHEFDWPGQSYQPWDWTYKTDSGGECGIPFDRRFNMPGPRMRTGGDFLTGSRNIYHSRNVGMVHFVLISSEHNATVGSEQYTWLEADLAAVNRSRTPWIVFGQHRPYYGNTIARFLPENTEMRKHLEPLMIKHQVDLGLFGHIHQYQRTCRMVAHTCNEKGPAYMVVGTAGATHQVAFLPQAKWVEKQSDLFGISKMVALNRTHMRVRWYLDKDGTIGDEFYVIRQDSHGD